MAFCRDDLLDPALEEGPVLALSPTNSKVLGPLGSPLYGPALSQSSHDNAAGILQLRECSERLRRSGCGHCRCDLSPEAARLQLRAELMCQVAVGSGR